MIPFLLGLSLTLSLPANVLSINSTTAFNATTYAPSVLTTVTMAPVVGSVSTTDHHGRRRALVASDNQASIMSSGSTSGYRGREGLPVSFRASPDDPMLSYLWDFGDGEQATGASVKHIYALNGNYVVRLTASLGNESISLTTRAIISNSPPSNFTISASTRLSAVNSPITFALSATSLGADNLVFYVDFGDGSAIQKVAAPYNASLPLPQVHRSSVAYAYSNPGSYTVKLISVTDDDTRVVASTFVSVLSLSLAQSAFSVAQGTSVALSVVPSEAAPFIQSVRWTFSDPVPSSAYGAEGMAVTHVYRRPGSYPVTATIRGTGNETILLATEVTVTAVLPGSFGLSSSATLIAQGDNVTFTARAKYPGDESLAFVLDFSDGTDPQTLQGAPGNQSDPSQLVWAASASHRFPVAGIYDVRLVRVVSPFETVQVASLKITVTAVALSPSLAHGAEGSSLTFLALPPQAASFLRYEWSFGDLSKPFFGPNATHVYSDQGTYNVSLRVSNPATNESVLLQGQSVIANTLPSAFTLSTSRRLVPEGGSADIYVSARDYGSVPISFVLEVAPGNLTSSGNSTAPASSTKNATDPNVQRFLLVASRADDVPDYQMLGGHLWTATTTVPFPSAGLYTVKLLEAQDRGQEEEVASLQLDVFSIGFTIAPDSDYSTDIPTEAPVPAPAPEMLAPWPEAISHHDDIMPMLGPGSGGRKLLGKQ